ncbi:hypothetical protein CMV30_09705 [Nibricoccus aquaticus]|uniref:DUF2264 domain-containing protein n=1 Tax=Nibricoccus aquaticus TaxID=2576891 RepID=A0A290QFU6_9BACT|nr:DUF2264 domain-containing protein [Nibricoccus aquaticus]ATC64208.1 hypothetical protein CMV30_09705 [Nibricoccus aquaticus]
MSTFARNPLKTRDDVQRLVHELIEPVTAHFSPGRAQVMLGPNRALYGDPAGLLEGFARPLWGLASLAAGGGKFKHWDLWRTGIENGTNPAHPEYWGEPGDYDQRSVEMGAFGAGLALAPKELWEKLSKTTQARLVAWISRINGVQLVQSNWLFFRVLVNLGLRTRGQPWSAERVEADLAKLDTFYLGNGWYEDGARAAHLRDGRTGDYYVPMAFHFYALIYARVAGASDPVRASRYLERARLFAGDFVHYFSADGAALPFGRSLTYRFAQGAFWGALAFAPVEAMPWPVVKGLYLRHLRWWMRQPIFSETGLLTIGYAYPNLAMAESYNSSGSPYWAMKAFLPLALPESHPFWRAEEAPLPLRPVVKTLLGARLVAVTDPQTREVTAINPGQEVGDWPRHAPQKYSKFAYSTRFGFSVPVSSATPQEGGFDSMLALSDDGRRFRVREQCFDAQVKDGVAYSRWLPWADVEVQTWLIAAESSHVRVHRVRSARKLWSFEGGFAAGYVGRADSKREAREDGVAVVMTPFGRSWMRDLVAGGAGGVRKAVCVDLGVSSHVLFSLSVMPGLRGEHVAEEFWVACVAGGGAENADAGRGADFRVELEGGAACRVLRAGAAWWSLSEGGGCGESSEARLSALRMGV